MNIKILHTGITEPQGFLAVGKHIGIKSAKRDLAIIYSEKPAVWAGVFTTNVVKAAPVIRNQEILNLKENIQAIVINSGNANACTGNKGLIDNQKMADSLANCLNIDKNKVLTASTGVIGVPLPIKKIVTGIKNATQSLNNCRQSALEAASAILTTDTFSKELSVKVHLGDKTIRIGGMAKGSGMIHPNMATMLGFLTTDANISREMLNKALKDSIKDSYNMISVDGDTSTNDMVTIMANGMANNKLIDCENEDYFLFKKALDAINIALAKQIIRDGEGANKLIEVNITGTNTDQDARLMCKSILNSSLVKTAMFGEDANWGRILCAMGYSGANFNQHEVTLKFESKFGSIELMKNGKPIIFSEEKAAEILKAVELFIVIELKDGNGKATGWGCDMSYEYVRINGEYRS